MANTTIGSGKNPLVLRISQDAYNGDAQYALVLDGVPVDGVLTASALHSSGETDIVTVYADLLPGRHSVDVQFLNDRWDGTADTDRNLYVEGITIDGLAVPDSSAAIYWDGTRSFDFTESGPPTPTNLNIGASTAPNLLQLRLSEDRYLGDAQYIISVDGHQIDGIQTATALHSLGQQDVRSVLGPFGPGPHVATVTFLNDRWDGTASTDRNLYVEGITVDGLVVPDSHAALYAGGSVDFSFTGPPITISQPIGSGPDSLVIKLSGDFYKDFAKYTIAVDGAPIDGILTAGAYHFTGLSDTLTVHGNWGPGAHTVTVNFVNDLYDGTAATDRNLHVDGITYNNVQQPNGSATLYAAGPRDFDFFDPSPLLPVSHSFGTGPDQVAIRISQDVYLGYAQYLVRLDGVPIDGAQQASAFHALDMGDVFAINTTLAAGQHHLSVEFLNDLWGGTPGTDRNLYVDGVMVNGERLVGDTSALYANGTADFIFGA
ncbi:carbohydrate-binding domain-containing protein [Falsiroseomonas oryzae]|uniref:carbohydrate-binding domain-containing protein n=1 Tax=Falsiroseomonas oryzae TaxID=2766473 RepID=UPI0022EB675C|nr:carbohydrate-binding domain-containing protein [Roseomonas sp. MO-31]